MFAGFSSRWYPTRYWMDLSGYMLVPKSDGHNPKRQSTYKRRGIIPLYIILYTIYYMYILHIYMYRLHIYIFYFKSIGCSWKISGASLSTETTVSTRHDSRPQNWQSPRPVISHDRTCLASWFVTGQKSHGRPKGFPYGSTGLFILTLWIPLVNCPITMENHHFQWVNPL